jgi:hypothetical protein
MLPLHTMLYFLQLKLITDSEGTLISSVAVVHSAPRSRQSDRLSLQSSELAPFAPSLLSECCPPPFDSGGTHSLAGRGGGGAN